MIIGSNYFFEKYYDFSSKDIDKIEFVENTSEYKKHYRGKEKCVFQIQANLPKDTYIREELNSNLGMVVGKFLIPEFNQQIGFTIEDLPKLRPLINILDEKHKYEEIIYNAYLENGDFCLTDKQRLAAYKSYRESRGLDFKEENYL